MLDMYPPMTLSRDEEIFLRHWMYEEMHCGSPVGPAKRLQREHGVISSDFAALIAVAMPAPADQEVAGIGPPPVAEPIWPWSAESLENRVCEARRLLAQRSADGRGFVPQGRGHVRTGV
jgi:hypothetical protein